MLYSLQFSAISKIHGLLEQDVTKAVILPIPLSAFLITLVTVISYIMPQLDVKTSRGLRSCLVSSNLPQDTVTWTQDTEHKHLGCDLNELGEDKCLWSKAHIKNKDGRSKSGQSFTSSIQPHNFYRFDGSSLLFISIILNIKGENFQVLMGKQYSF